jgi:hemin uptake protein HemP
MSDPNLPTPVDETAIEPVETLAAEPSGENATLKNIPKIIRFESLARCGDEIWIENDGQIYRLRKTRQGKLILTK